MEMETLHDLFIDELKDLYHAEGQLTKALPKMAKAATHPELKKAFETHLVETKAQIDRLEEVFKLLDEPVKGKLCHAMKGLIEETTELLGEDAADDVLDAGLIACAQRVEHYEIAGYGTVRTYAKLMGHMDVAKLLQQTLDEEGATDKKLTKLAESSINIDAMSN